MACALPCETRLTALAVFVGWGIPRHPEHKHVLKRDQSPPGAPRLLKESVVRNRNKQRDAILRAGQFRIKASLASPLQAVDFITECRKQGMGVYASRMQQEGH